ncbi:hypothetical protein MRB53_041022 [Persea americana]|nr:hypothetical protein MRB53_041022 [Persea americana]
MLLDASSSVVFLHVHVHRVVCRRQPSVRDSPSACWREHGTGSLRQSGSARKFRPLSDVSILSPSKNPQGWNSVPSVVTVKDACIAQASAVVGGGTVACTRASRNPGRVTVWFRSISYSTQTQSHPVSNPSASQNPAASSDINKILRADYGNLLYSSLAAEALTAWSEWPELHPYFHRTGWIALNEAGSDTASRIREQTVIVGGFLAGTDLDGFDSAYWNPDAGWCDAAAATASLSRAAVERGVTYVQREVVSIVHSPGEGDTDSAIGVRCSDGSQILATQLVLATGAWTSSLLAPIEDALKIPHDDQIERQLSATGVAVAHYTLSDADVDSLEAMPVVVYGGHGEVIPPPKENRLLKYTNAHTFTNYTTTSPGHASLSQRLCKDTTSTTCRLSCKLTCATT